MRTNCMNVQYDTHTLNCVMCRSPNFVFSFWGASLFFLFSSFIFHQFSPFFDSKRQKKKCRIPARLIRCAHENFQLPNKPRQENKQDDTRFFSHRYNFFSSNFFADSPASFVCFIFLSTWVRMLIPRWFFNDFFIVCRWLCILKKLFNSGVIDQNAAPYSTKSTRSMWNKFAAKKNWRRNKKINILYSLLLR